MEKLTYNIVYKHISNGKLVLSTPNINKTCLCCKKHNLTIAIEYDSQYICLICADYIITNKSMTDFQLFSDTYGESESDMIVGMMQDSVIFDMQDSADFDNSW